MATNFKLKDLQEKLNALTSKDAITKMIWMWIQQGVIDLPTFKALLPYLDDREEFGNECFYKGREIREYDDKGRAIFKRPTYEGYLREINF